MGKTILSLFDRSGVWSKPYADNGYHVVMVDIAHEPGSFTEGNITKIGADISKFDYPGRPWAVLAAPPCTCFCRPAARWWKRQDADGQTAKDVALFKAALRLCSLAESWWALENPPGRHRKLIANLPNPSWQYQPWEYGDPWHKQTYIWGTATKPIVTNPVTPAPTRRTPNGRTQGRIAFMSSSWKHLREQTPEGFAQAFYYENN